MIAGPPRSRARGCYDGRPTLVERSSTREAEPDDLSDVDDDLRAFVRGLGLPGRRPPPPCDERPPGTRIAPHLEVKRTLGRGAVGVVYLARDLRLRRDVAVKLVETTTPSAADRIEREAQAMAKLGHPNVVTVHEVGACTGGLYIAMEHVEGGTLRQWLAAKPRTWPEIVAAFLQAARGLQAAHAAGLLHRDFKPDNVLVGADGRVRVADFGLARAWHDREDIETRDAIATEPSTTDIAGTPAYLAPEVVLHREIGPLADQFALGVSLFEALCKQRPYAAPGAWIEHSRARRPDPELPAWLRAVLMRAIDLDPAARHPDVDALARALEHGLGRASRRRRTIAVAGISVIAVAGGIAVGSWMRDDACDGVGETIDATWNASRRDEVVRAITATESPLVGASLAAIDEQIDAWVQTWRTERHDACAATRVQGEQSEARMDLRIDCLDRVAVELDALVSVLADADAEIVARTDELLRGVPSPTRCSDPQAIEDGEAVPAEKREVHDPLFRELVAAEDQLEAGRAARVRDVLDDLIERIDAEDLRGLGARARLARGRLLLELGRRSEAADELSAAHAMALAIDDRSVQLPAMLDLARAIGRAGAGTEEALRLLTTLEAAEAPAIDITELDAARVETLFFGHRLEQAEAAARRGLERTPEDHPKRTRLLSLLGTTLRYQNRVDEAIVAHEQAIAAAEAVRGPEHPVVAAALGNLATTQHALGRHDDALATLRRALAIREATLGPDAPAVGQTHKEIGDVLAGKGDGPGAVAQYERALAIHRTADDEMGIVLATASLAAVIMTMGRQPEAIDMLRHLIPIAERQFGSESVNLASLLTNLSSQLYTQGELAEARRHGDRALTLYDRTLPADDPAIAIACLTQGRVLAELGQHEAGLAMLDRAERIFRAKLPPDAVEHAGVVGSRADILLFAGRVAEAARMRTEEVALQDRAQGSDHPDTIAARYRQGRDLLAAGEHARARDALERALAALEHVAIDPDAVAKIRYLLAQALWPDRSARPRARELARQSREEMRAIEHPRLGELEAWMAERGIE
jgi:tetratricopeptide (TPR) repeat protein